MEEGQVKDTSPRRNHALSVMHLRVRVHLLPPHFFLSYPPKARKRFVSKPGDRESLHHMMQPFSSCLAGWLLLFKCREALLEKLVWVCWQLPNSLIGCWSPVSQSWPPPCRSSRWAVTSPDLTGLFVKLSPYSTEQRTTASAFLEGSECRVRVKVRSMLSSQWKSI